MRKDDFTNWTPDRCKQKIHEYQKSRDPELLSLLLAKYDKYLVGLAWTFLGRAQGVTLKDLYHSAIIGFGYAIQKFKVQAPSKLIIAVIKAYVKREIETRHINKQKEEFKEYLRPSSESVESFKEELTDVYLIINSAYLSDEDRSLVLLRFEDQLSLQEISEKLGICESWVSDKLKRVLIRIRRKIEEDGKE